MRMSATALSLAALLAMTAPLAAQDEETTEATQAPPPAGGGLSLGEDVPGEPYTAEVIGDWELKCVPVPEGDEPCQIYQLLLDPTGNPTAEITLFRLKGEGQAVAGAVANVPLETLLPAQLTVAVDGGKPRRYPYAYCTPVGCVARIGLTAEDVAAFKAGNAASVSLVPAVAPDQQVSLTMSLKGFTAAYDKTTEIDP